MLFRKVFQWTVVLLLLIAAVGLYVGWSMWQQRNALLLKGIRAEVAQKVPDWDVGIDAARMMDRRGQVRLRGISIKPRGESVPLLHIPECFITIDPDLFLKTGHPVVVRRLTLSKPTVTLIRHADGTWNWQKLGRPARSEHTPEVIVEAGSFVVRLEAAGGLPETEITSHDVALNLLPAGLHRYLIQGASQIDGAGGLSFSGRIDLNTGVWELTGKADGLDMSPELLEKAAAFSPAVKRQVAELSGPAVTVTPGDTPPSSDSQRTGTIRPISQVADGPAPGESLGTGGPQLSLPNLGLVASLAVEFELRSDGIRAIPDYRLTARVMEGQVTEPLSPVPLSGLEGELLLENDRVVIRRVAAAGGDSRLSLDGEFCLKDGRWTKQFNILATNLWLDPQVGELLSSEGQRLFQLINPSGRFTVRASYDSEAETPVSLEQLTALDCSVRHQLFPYPVEGISGTIEQVQNGFRVALTGFAAGRPVVMNGLITPPDGADAAIVHVETDQFPLDRRFTEAIVAAEHQGVRKAIESLSLTGTADIRADFVRAAGPDQRFQLSLDVDVTDAALTFENFPYPIEQLSGRVHYHPREERVWRFTNLSGRHGPTVLSGEASFDVREQPGRLRVHVNAHNGRLDETLQHACITADPDLARVWNELNPSGWLQVEGLQLDWSPGSRPQVDIASLRVQQGTVVPRSFPFRWDDVAAELAWRNGRVDIGRVEARHGGTTIFIDGAKPAEPALFELTPNGPHRWVLRLPDISVRKLDPAGEFVAALPSDVASVMRNLNVRGPIDAELLMDLRGWPGEQGQDAVTMAWHVHVNLRQNQLTAGLDLTDVTGRVEAVVQWNNHSIQADGWIDLDRARALDTTFTDVRGPFSVHGGEVVVGSAAVLRKLKAPSDEQLTAAVYGGAVKVNAVAQIDPHDAEQSVYQVQIDIDNADLSRWAEEWGAGAYDVAGTVNGMMNLTGRGTSPQTLAGDGCWLHVTQARLGELPQMAQLLAQLTQFQPPEKTAFHSAFAEFSVRNGVFDFGSPVAHRPGDTRRILFDGDMLRMVGRGVIPFAPGVDPRMNLTFLSKVAERNRLIPDIPLISSITRNMVDNWIRIQVTGTPNSPRIQVITQVPIGNVNDALREIFTAVEAGLTPMLPRPPMP